MNETELKAKAYDLIVTIQTSQAELNSVNTQLQALNQLAQDAPTDTPAETPTEVTSEPQ